MLFSFLVAMFLTTVLVPPMMRLAPRLGLIDLPNHRKVHKLPTPLCGGIAVALGSLVPAGMWGEFDASLAWTVAAAALIVVIGAVDDARPLHYGWRLFAQMGAVALIMMAGVRFGALPFLGLDPAPWWIAVPVTALFVLACTNAVNLADGLDGLAGGLTIPTLLAIMLLAYQGTGGTVLVVCAALIGAVSGFLRFNTHPAVVFLGDAGSTLLGFTAAVLTILLVERCHAAVNPGIVLLLMGVPLLDTIYAVVRRTAAGRSPFMPDRRHLHHQFLDLGLSQVHVVTVLYFLQGVMALSAILLRYESDMVVLGAFATIALAVILPLARISARRAAAGPANPLPDDATGSNAERRNLWLRRRTWLPAATLTTVKVGIAGFMIVGALLPAAVPHDLAVLATCAAGLWLGKRLLLGNRALPLQRVLIYAAAGCSAYIAVNAAADHGLLAWSIAVYLGVLTAVLIVAIRVSRREHFRVTPQDLLVLFLAVAVPNLSDVAAAEHHVREIVAVLIVLFYATEFVLARDPNPRLGLDVAAMLSFCFIGIAGFA